MCKWALGKHHYIKLSNGSYAPRPMLLMSGCTGLCVEAIQWALFSALDDEMSWAVVLL